MYTLDPKIIESRLAIVKAMKEADETRDILDVLEDNKPALHALGAEIQFQINVLYTQYLSIGLTYEEFHDDLIEWFKRCGFAYREDKLRAFDRADGIIAYDLVCGLDTELPFTEILLNFQVIKGIK